MNELNIAIIIEKVTSPDEAFIESLELLGLGKKQILTAWQILNEKFDDSRSKITVEEGRIKIPTRTHHVSTSEQGYFSFILWDCFDKDKFDSPILRRSEIREEFQRMYDQISNERDLIIGKREYEEDLIWSNDVLRRIGLDINNVDEDKYKSILSILATELNVLRIESIYNLYSGPYKDLVDIRATIIPDFIICENGIGKCEHCRVFQYAEVRQTLEYAKNLNKEVRWGRQTFHNRQGELGYEFLTSYEGYKINNEKSGLEVGEFEMDYPFVDVSLYWLITDIRERNTAYKNDFIE